MNANQFANWTPEEPCQCAEENYFTMSLTLEDVQMLSGDVEWVLAFCRQQLNRWTNGFYERLRIKDLTHDAVQVRYKCDSCGHEFRRTYELKGENNGKRNRWGFYGQRRNEKRRSTKRIAFVEVEECFAQMWENYNFIIRNCAHWAREFYAKVAGPEESVCSIM